MTALLLLVLGLAIPHLGWAETDEGEFLSEVRQLTFAGRRAGEGYFSTDGQQLIFQSERDPANPFYQIHLLDLATGDIAQVSPGVGKTTCGWLHPDGNRVLYASTHEDDAALAKMRAELEFRASGRERRYSWDYDEHFEIYAQDLATGARRNLTNTLGYDAEGSYSPDGSRIAFASNRRAYSVPMSAADAEIFTHDKSYMMDIYIMDSDGSNLQRLTDVPGYDGGPFFSPDGSSITWRRFSADGSVAEIYTMRLDDKRERQLTDSGVMSWAPYFHPSGDYLIYASNAEGFANFELFMVDAAGRRDPVRVTHTEGFDGLPVFTPDGKGLAWTSNRTAAKQSQIFLGAWNDGAARRALGLPPTRELANTAPELGRVTTQEITSQDAETHLKHLTAPAMDGRLTGTPGEVLATEYVAGVFAALGLVPAGDDGTYFQHFSFTAGGSLSEGNRISIGGLEPTPRQQLHRDWRPLAFSKNGSIEPASVVFAGYGIVAPAAENQAAYDAYAGLDVRDKWVMVLRYQPESIAADRRRYLLRFSDLAYKASWAKRLGAIGMIVVTGPSAGVKHELVGLKMDAATATTSIGAISVSNELGAALLGAAAKNLAEVQVELDAGEVVAGFDIAGVTFAAAIDIVREQRSGRNVIARLAANSVSSAPPIVVGAHVDHLGRGQASGSLARDDEAGQIHPGADDNASGVAGMLEISQFLADQKRRGQLRASRDVLFVAWSGEELGTLGSSHFVDTLGGSDDLSGKIAAYINLDMIGRLDDKAYLQGTGSSSVWASEIERRNVPVGLPLTLSTDPYLPTDSTPFYMKKVPVLSAFTGVHEEYSTPRDTPELINYEGIRDISQLLANIARSLARATDVPDYQEVERSAGGVGRTNMRVYLGTIPAYGQEEGVVGVKLQGAVKGSPAEQAGIRSGDVLVGLAGEEIETIYDFMSILGGLRAGEETDLTVRRDGAHAVLRIVPAARE